MFKRISPSAAAAAHASAQDTVTLLIDGQPVQCRRNESVAAVLFAQPSPTCRDTPVSGAPRAPYCMMGVCFDCLVEIDGEANRQACMTPVRDGMRVQRQRGARVVRTGADA
jgi:predicted molibdopterin-dependent oxidoreductase YjgC